jgi:hypothetical protein
LYSCCGLPADQTPLDVSIIQLLVLSPVSRRFPLFSETGRS